MGWFQRTASDFDWLIEKLTPAGAVDEFGVLPGREPVDPDGPIVVFLQHPEFGLNRIVREPSVLGGRFTLAKLLDDGMPTLADVDSQLAGHRRTKIARSMRQLSQTAQHIERRDFLCQLEQPGCLRREAAA